MRSEIEGSPINRNKLFSPATAIPAMAIIVIVAIAGLVKITQDAAKAKHERQIATATVLRWADKLNSMTTESGVFIQWSRTEEGHQGKLPESDPWGNNLQVMYSKGGVKEILKVRSFGPDGISHTPDDITSVRSAINFSGLGSGIKNNIEETTAGGAKGLVGGALDALAERGLLPDKDKDDDE